MRRLQRLFYSDTDLDELGLLSRKTRWRMRRAGTFPEPKSVGSRKLYPVAAIHEWAKDPEHWRTKESAQ